MKFQKLFLLNEKSRSMSPRNDEEDEEIRLIDDYEGYHRRRVKSSKTNPKKKKNDDAKRRKKRLNRNYSAFTKPEPEPTMITMIYYGKGINIPYDTQIFEAKDEITIYQQHCGGENLLVYAGLHQARGNN
jgi:hypothetical protein